MKKQMKNFALQKMKVKGNASKMVIETKISEIGRNALNICCQDSHIKAVILMGNMFLAIGCLEEYIEDKNNGYGQLYNRMKRVIRTNSIVNDKLQAKIKVVWGHGQPYEYLMKINKSACEEMSQTFFNMENKLSQLFSKHGMGEHRNLLAKLAIPIFIASMIRYQRQIHINESIDLYNQHCINVPKTNTMESNAYNFHVNKLVTDSIDKIFPVPNVWTRTNGYVREILSYLDISEDAFYEPIYESLKKTGNYIGSIADVLFNKYNRLFSEDFIQRVNNEIENK